MLRMLNQCFTGVQPIRQFSAVGARKTALYGNIRRSTSCRKMSEGLSDEAASGYCHEPDGDTKVSYFI